jgi:hypothetical protein
VIFLLEYDRQAGQLLRLDEFAASDRSEALSARLELEIDLFKRGIVREVVLLEAESKAALTKTHNRYFRNVDDLAKSVAATIKLGDSPASGSKQ